jgi:hypothetical protein
MGVSEHCSGGAPPRFGTSRKKFQRVSPKTALTMKNTMVRVRSWQCPYNMHSTPTVAMFSVRTDYERDLMRAFLVPQVTSEALAERIPGQESHLRSLDAALQRAKCLLRFVTVSLQSEDRWSPRSQETFGYHLSACSTMIAGALDGMMIVVSRDRGVEQMGKVTFRNTPFPHNDWCAEQDAIMELRSPAKPPTESAHLHGSQDMYVDFFSVMNFWKHYMPLPPPPKYFPEEKIFDFQLEFGGVGVTIDNGKVTTSGRGRGTECETSGPIIHDLIIPTYNGACRLLHSLAQELGVEGIGCEPM